MRDTGFRPDIQGLRAIAVSLVVALPPLPVAAARRLHRRRRLLRHLRLPDHRPPRTQRRSATGRVRLLDFYGRRARRLLPAAALVLAVTWLVVAGRAAGHPAADGREQVRASALYFQNWVLANDAVDYLDREDAPSPVQHFWSLSVEEQFYLVWPLLFLLAGAVAWAVAPARSPSACRGADASRDARSRSRCSCASFVYSVHDTAGNPAAAYFVTPTRMWELALGGIAGAAAPRGRARGSAGSACWHGSASARSSHSVLLTARRRSPAGSPLSRSAAPRCCSPAVSPRAKLGPAPLTSSRPFVFVGDISYSLYLWHWPIIVLWGLLRGLDRRVDGPAIVLASLVAAWLTTKLFEDPVRKWRVLHRRPVFSLATVATVAIPVLLVALTSPPKPGPLPTNVDAAHPGAAQLHTPSASASTSASASASASPSSSPSGYLPPLAVAPDDLALTSGNGCQADTYETKVKTCAFGDTKTPQRTIVLAGDSHAGQWSSALDKVGRERHWKIISVLHGSCRFGSTLTLLDDKPFTACRDWNVDALQVVKKLKPDTVIMSNRPNLGTPANPKPGADSWRQIAGGIVDYTSQLIALGIKTVAIRETPEIKDDVPDCLASRNGSISSCGRSRADAIQQNTPMVVAHERLGPKLPLVDMNDLICGKKTCAPVVGNVIVYRDSHHLGRTYTLSLATYLADRLVRTGAMGPRPSS